MNNCDVNKVRNFAIAGHAGCGKTSLSDLMLFKSGKVTRQGKVDQKNSVSDFRPEEQERQHSCSASYLNCTWKDNQFVFIDTPGNPDFIGDATAGLNVCDLALIVVDGVNGLEFGATRAWRTARERNCPRMVFVNTLDRENADFQKALDSLQAAYGKTTCVPFTLPIGKEADLSAVYNVLGSEEAPAEIADLAESYKSAVLDTAAESDEELMMRYLEGEELSPEEVAKGLHAAVMDGSLVPVFFGSVEKDLGVEELMDGIVNLGPNPTRQGSVPLAGDGEVECTPDGPGQALVFKSVVDPFIGQLTVMRVFAGTFKADAAEVFNVSKGEKERIGGLIVLNGKEQENISQAGPGDIVAIPKLTTTAINDTVGAGSAVKPLKPIEFPKPNMSYAIYAAKPGEEDKIASGLQKLCDEDPTCVFTRQSETREMVLSGMGDTQLSIAIKKLKTNNKVEVELRAPKIPYRETIQGNGDHRYRHKKQSGGRGQFAEVALRVAPLQDGDEEEFENAVVGGNIPKNYIPACEKGVNDARSKGPLAHCQVINVKTTVYDGKHHAVDSSDMAFQIAARSAFREAVRQAKPIILEPIQEVAITAPDEYMGDISGDLNSRRGRILGMESDEGLQVTKAEVPLAEMHGYSNQLRSLTQGRGSFEMEFLRYDPVPANVQQQIVAAVEAREAEEG